MPAQPVRLLQLNHIWLYRIQADKRNLAAKLIFQPIHDGCKGFSRRSVISIEQHKGRPGNFQLRLWFRLVGPAANRHQQDHHETNGRSP